MLAVKDKDTILHISYEDMIKYHGRQYLGGVALAYKIMELSFRRLLPNGVPERDLISFFSGLGENGRGVIDGLEMVTRVKSRNRLNIDNSKLEHHPGALAPNGGRYYFELTYGQNTICLALKDGLLPEEFLVLSKKALSQGLNNREACRLQELKEELAALIMTKKPEELFKHSL
ncbi:MAG: hypothetical protein KGZ50_07250 [Peptococcaceae bacterium]|nr:hypothetical protein [Peptococcaceae bacterium]